MQFDQSSHAVRQTPHAARYIEATIKDVKPGDIVRVAGIVLTVEDSDVGPRLSAVWGRLVSDQRAVCVGLLTSEAIELR